MRYTVFPGWGTVPTSSVSATDAIPANPVPTATISAADAISAEPNAVYKTGTDA